MKTEIKAGDEVRISKKCKIDGVYSGFVLLDNMYFTGHKRISKDDYDDTFRIGSFWYSRKMLVPKRTRK